MLRVIVAALVATSASARGWADHDVIEELTEQSLERRHNVATGHNQKGNEKHRRTTESEKKGGLNGADRQVIQARILKSRDSIPDKDNHKTSGGGKKDKKREKDEEDMELNAGGGGGGKSAGKSPAKAPSNQKRSAPATPTTSSSSSTPRAPKTGKESPGSGGSSGGGHGSKSRKLSTGICSKRLHIAYKQLRSLGEDGPFGLIEDPQDVTELCEFVPPNDMDPNFGCPFVYLPWMGFLEGEDYEAIFPGEEAGVAFNNFVLYCQCHQGFELGCAAKIPHGPPTERKEYEDAEGNPKEVIVNGYSEYIPFSSPADRADYCKMVGVWNGDFSPDIVEDFTQDVTDCGCFFIGTAKDMVGTCPGVELGAFFDRPDLTDTPSYSPTLGPSSYPPTTITPTFSPTVNPTSDPTQSPSLSPTESPTSGATTIVPTFSPTGSPTFLECVAGDDGVLYPVCNGQAEDEFCDGTDDTCDTERCECDLGVKFCETEVNPCE